MNDLVYLTQTDTTTGLLSQNNFKLNSIKQRAENQKLIISTDGFTTLKKFARIPKKFKKLVRNSNKVTFIYSNNLAIRTVKEQKHLSFLKKINWCHTTSANISGQKQDLIFAKEKADIVVYDGYFEEKSPSQILKLGKKRCKKLR